MNGHFTAERTNTEYLFFSTNEFKQEHTYTTSQNNDTDEGLCVFFKQIELITGNALSETDKKILSDNSRIKKIRKRHYFLHEGDACKYLGFIVKGATKMYAINDRGQEAIISFSLENSWITDLESLLKGTNANFYIEAVEDMELVTIERSQLFYLLENVPVFNHLFQSFQTAQLIECQKRIQAALSLTAEERYINLLTTKPEYLLRFTQNMLACYLGIKPETLSRVRKR